MMTAWCASGKLLCLHKPSSGSPPKKYLRAVYIATGDVYAPFMLSDYTILIDIYIDQLQDTHVVVQQSIKEGAL